MMIVIIIGHDLVLCFLGYLQIDTETQLMVLLAIHKRHFDRWCDQIVARGVSGIQQ